MLRRVALERTEVPEEPSASFIRVTRIGELGTMLAVTSNRRTLRRVRRRRSSSTASEVWDLAMSRRMMNTGTSSVLTRYESVRLWSLPQNEGITVRGTLQHKRGHYSCCSAVTAGQHQKWTYWWCTTLYINLADGGNYIERMQVWLPQVIMSFQIYRGVATNFYPTPVRTAQRSYPYGRLLMCLQDHKPQN
jgi:hypothetical protein